MGCVTGYMCYARHMFALSQSGWTSGSLAAAALTVMIAGLNALGAAMILPQVRHVYRTRSAAGLSAIWVGMAIAVNTGWTAYGVANRQWGIVPVSAISVAAYIAIGAGLARFGGPVRSTLAGVAGGLSLALVPAFVYVARGWGATGLTLGVLYAVQLAPAVTRVHRSHDISGVSTATWILACVESLLWGIYGLAQRDVGLGAMAASGTIMSALVLVRVLAPRPEPSMA